MVVRDGVAALLGGGLVDARSEAGGKPQLWLLEDSISAPALGLVAQVVRNAAVHEGQGVLVLATERQEEFYRANARRAGSSSIKRVNGGAGAGSSGGENNITFLDVGEELFLGGVGQGIAERIAAAIRDAREAVASRGGKGLVVVLDSANMLCLGVGGSGRVVLKILKQLVASLGGNCAFVVCVHRDVTGDLPWIRALESIADVVVELEGLSTGRATGTADGSFRFFAKTTRAGVPYKHGVHPTLANTYLYRVIKDVHFQVAEPGGSYV